MKIDKWALVVLVSFFVMVMSIIGCVRTQEEVRIDSLQQSVVLTDIRGHSTQIDDVAAIAFVSGNRVVSLKLGGKQKKERGNHQ